MFKRKYNINIINSKWESIKRNLKIDLVPRKDELIFFGERYHTVLNVIHRINDDNSSEIFVVISELTTKKEDLLKKQ